MDGETTGFQPGDDGMPDLAASLNGQQQPRSSSDLIGLFDARKWAAEFVRMVAEKPQIAADEGAMAAWFATAIMTGYDHALKLAAAGPGKVTPGLMPDLGRTAFESWAVVTGEAGAWDDLPAAQRSAWEAAAVSVANEVTGPCYGTVRDYLQRGGAGQ